MDKTTYNKLYYQRNPEYHRERIRKYRQANPEAQKERAKRYFHTWYEKNKIKYSERLKKDIKRM